jgi:beta-glucosidase
MSDNPATRFPDDFAWGAATSAYQIEGAADSDGRGRSIWDTFCEVPGAVEGGHSGAVAADHYNRYADDIELMRSLGLQVYRFSVAWPRVVPDGTGAPNPAGLDFYRRQVDALLEAGIKPFLTLYHWDLPQALEDAGGWSSRDTAAHFADYAAIVYEALHDRVTNWSTLNEPWCSSLLGYAAGVHAPGVQDPDRATRAIHHLLLGHGRATAAMRAIDPSRAFGITLNLTPVRSVDEDPDAHALDGVRRVDGLRNRVWSEPILRGRYPDDVQSDLEAFGGLPVEEGDLELIGQPLDWLGVNYYNDELLTAAPGASIGSAPGVSDLTLADAGPESTDMDWPVTPDGLRSLLVGLAATYPDLPPVYITENGAAYDDPFEADGSIHDVRRIAYLDGHLRAIAAAIDAGVDVKGYFQWSLLDNFEWAEGYSKRFGIVHVDYQTQVRTPRDSALWYRDVIAANGLVNDTSDDSDVYRRGPLR